MFIATKEIGVTSYVFSKNTNLIEHSSQFRQLQNSHTINIFCVQLQNIFIRHIIYLWYFKTNICNSNNPKVLVGSYTLLTILYYPFIKRKKYISGLLKQHWPPHEKSNFFTYTIVGIHWTFLTCQITSLCEEIRTT